MSRVVVYHRGYGCDTGCCGHYVEFADDPEISGTHRSQFHFDHPGNESPVEFAQRMVTETFGAEHVQDLDWEHCEIVTSQDCNW